MSTNRRLSLSSETRARSVVENTPANQNVAIGAPVAASGPRRRGLSDLRSLAGTDADDASFNIVDHRDGPDCRPNLPLDKETKDSYSVDCLGEG